MADQAAGVANSAGVNARLGIQHDAAGLDRTGGQHDRARLGFVMLPGESIEERDPARESVLVGEDLVRDGVGAQRKIRKLFQFRDDHVQAAESCPHIATAPTFPTVMAGRPSIISCAQHRRTLEQDGNAEFFSALLEKNLRAARLVRRAAINSIRHVEVVFGARAGDAHQPFYFVVVRGQIVITKRPVFSETLHRLGLVVERPMAETGPAPGVGSAAHTAQACPMKIVE